MDKNLDWTEIWDQNDIAKKANYLVDDILKQMFEEKLEFHNKLNLSLFELCLIYRWPLHVGVNTFIERLMRVHAKQNNGIDNSYPLSEINSVYFKNTVKAVHAYYYDYSINYKLLNDISEVFVDSTNVDIGSIGDFVKPQESLNPAKHYGLKILLKKVFFQCENIFVMLMKPKVIGEHSHWLRKLFLFGNSIDFYRHKFSNQNKKIDFDTREDLKTIFKNIFLKNISFISDELGDQKNRQLAKIFGDWIDHILPLSIIEGLNKRFYFYNKVITGWSIEQLHSFTGYFYNDNFKVFAILARRNGAKFIGHTHGNSNYTQSHYKFSNMLQFLDYYTTYGTRVPDDLLDNPGSNNVIFIPIGSTTFQSLKKWNKSIKSDENLTLLYPSGPLRDFMADLQEISPEKNWDHRLQVLTFLDKLLLQYPLLRVLYKPFPGTFTNDPIKEKCAKWISKGRIEIIEKRPGKIYPTVDVVLWDSISTGFLESIAAGVPVIGFISEHEYEQTTPQGKMANDILTDTGVVCFDINSAIWSFERILNDLSSYKKDTATSLRMIMKDMGMPISRKEWHSRFKRGINEARAIHN